MYGKCINDFCILFCYFLESEAQELGNIGVTFLVITYYENQQQLLPSYMGTIPELIPPLLYIQNLHSSPAFKYPPSCFNLLVTPLKM